MEPIECGLIGCGDSVDETTGSKRVLFAANQPQYNPLPAVVFPDGKVCTEWKLTEDERARILAGENVRLWIWTFGHPLQPVALEVTDQEQP